MEEEASTMPEIDAETGVELGEVEEEMAQLRPQMELAVERCRIRERTARGHVLAAERNAPANGTAEQKSLQPEIRAETEKPN